MTSPTILASIAELEAQRTAIDAALKALSVFLVEPAPNGKHDRVSHKPARADRRARADAGETWATARALFEQGQTAKKIAKALKVTVSQIYQRSSKENWKRGGAGTLPSSRWSKTPRRRCEECDQTTNRNPCQHCGAPWTAAAAG